jgi:hypothetical protein
VGLNVIEIGPATENEMIAAFLRAEIDSSRYGNNFVKTSLAQRRLQRNIIDSPNLADAVENDVRKELMRYRGYDARSHLFAGFPIDVRWRRVRLDASDFESMRYINDARTRTPHWTNLSDGTRLVSVGAATSASGLPTEIPNRLQPSRRPFEKGGVFRN